LKLSHIVVENDLGQRSPGLLYVKNVSEPTCCAEVDNVQILASLTAPDAASGDYNQDGTINAADYTLWRNAIVTGDLAADGNGDGLVNRLDYDVWTLHYGEVGGSGSLTAVPEPTTAVLMLAAAAVFTAAFRRIRPKCAPF
jgi:hypothetical protein